MFSIVGLAIYLTRGDTAIIPFRLTDTCGNTYIPSDKDVIEFTVKKDVADTEPTIQKRMVVTKIPEPTGNTLVQISTKLLPEDTKNLDVGYYKYDVQVTTQFGDVFTVITPHTFRLTEEVS